MHQTTVTKFQLGEHRSIKLDHGSIWATDGSGDSVNVYGGTDAINDAVAAYLPNCTRSTQERFLQILTDHIRTTENSH
jgi:hypothetical protein